MRRTYVARPRRPLLRAVERTSARCGCRRVAPGIPHPQCSYAGVVLHRPRVKRIETVDRGNLPTLGEQPIGRVLPMKPAPPVTTMRRLADITRRRRSVPRDIPSFSPKSSFRWLAEQGSSGLILSSLLKDLSKVLILGQVWWSLAFRTSCWLRRPGSLPRPPVGLSRSRAAPPRRPESKEGCYAGGESTTPHCVVRGQLCVRFLRSISRVDPTYSDGRGHRSHGRCARRLTVSDIQLRPGP